MGAHIIEDDARLEHHVVMKFSIAGIATTSLRILFKLNCFIDIIFHDMKFQRLYARFVRQNKMTGGEENFFHCKRCRCCYSKAMEDKHQCVEGAMHHNCPVCFEYLFDSTRDITVLQCGHTMHLERRKDMGQHNRYTCPICSKSMCDMTSLWKKLDEEVAANPMPKSYENKMIKRH